MININEELSDAISRGSTNIVDLVCIANVEVNKTIVDETIVSLNGNTITVTGLIDDDLVNDTVVLGEEIASVLSVTRDTLNGNTEVVLQRHRYGTSQSELEAIGLHFRRVVVFPDIKSYKITDRIGDMKQVFPVEVSSGMLSIYDDVSNWSVFSDTKKYFLRKKQSPVYIFKGEENNMVLKYTYFTDGKTDKTAVKNRLPTIDIKLKSKLNLWYNEKLKINQQIKNATPKEFFSIIFDEPLYNIYYSNGNVESDFLEVNNIHTKEYDTYSSLLKSYCSTGVRLSFDRLEKIKLFTDITVDSIVSNKTIEGDIFDIKTDSTNQLIYNSISTSIDEKLPIFNFDDLDNKYVSYGETLDSTIPVSSLFELDGNGDYQPVPIEIVSTEMSQRMAVGDTASWRFTSATLGRTVEFMLSAITKFTNESGDPVVRLYPAINDKDKATYFRGKLEKVIVPLINESADGNVLFGRIELPTIWKFSRTLTSGTVDFNLKYPILPKVDGVEQIGNYEITANFGTTKNLGVGTYAGYCEETDGVYGDWTGGTELLYFNETYQFDNTTRPPIGLLANKIDDTSTNIVKYDTFDNSNIILSISRAEDSDKDAKINVTSDISISSLSLIEDEPISMVGNRILEVEYLDEYKIGDVLVAKKPDPLTAENSDIKLYDETLSRIKWSIISIDDTGTQKFIYLDSDFPSDFTFIKFPRASIIHLQEMYILGNPVVRYTSEVGATSSDVDSYGYLSDDLYGVQNYNMTNTGMTDTYDSKRLIGYVLDNYNGVITDKTKFLLPVETSFSTFNLELLDVVEINEPIFTKIGLGTKWLIVSEEFTDSKTGIKIKYIMQNINTESSEPFDIDIAEVLSYEPVELPTYASGGKEGDVGDGQDGEAINKKDETLGEVWLAEVESSKFVAKIYEFNNLEDDNTITLYDFGGTLVSEYLDVFFKDDEYIEFGIKIEEEVIFVKNITKDNLGNYRCQVIKRQLYDTPKITDINTQNTNKKATFYVITTQTRSDGTFYARSVHIGAGDTYFKFDPINGANFRGNFTVNDNNKVSDNELWSAFNNNKTFREIIEPISTASYALKEGDMWIDTNEGNKLYVYESGVWEDSQDENIATAIMKNKNFYQTTEPISTIDYTIAEYDIWIDTDDNNKRYIYISNVWTEYDDSKGNIERGEIKLNSNTDVDGVLEVYKKDVSDYGFKSFDGDNLANSNKYTQLVDGSIDLYERGVGSLFYKTNGIKKFTEGTATNNEVVDIKTNVTYGTNTDWLDTKTIAYLKDKIFAQNRGVSMWADSIKINDNQFTAKVYEKYLAENSVESLLTISNSRTSKQSYTYTTTETSGTDFEIKYGGSMGIPVVVGAIQTVSEVVVASVKLEIFKDSVLHKTVTKNYGGNVFDTFFSLAYMESFPTSHDVYAKVTFYSGEYDYTLYAGDGGTTYSDEAVWVSGDISHGTFTKTTVENNLSTLYFESNEK